MTVEQRGGVLTGCPFAFPLLFANDPRFLLFCKLYSKALLWPMMKDPQFASTPFGLDKMVPTLWIFLSNNQQKTKKMHLFIN